MGNVTIKQIARLAGVSVSAVSYALNGKKGVSEATRARILQIIEELNYTPNVNSRRLILQRSFNLLVCLDTAVATLDNLFFTEVLNAVVARAAELGYNTMLTLEGVSSGRDRLLEVLSGHNADGVIFLRDIPSSLCAQIEQTGTPLVVADSHRLDAPYPRVCTDMEQAAYLATRHLIEHGHRDIAFIGMDRLPDFYVHVFNGYRRALSEDHLQLHPQWVQTDACDEPSAQRCMARILESPVLPTGIFCAGDLFAIGAMNYLQDHAYQVPADFSVVGVDDIVMARYYHPPLTTIEIDKQQMGARAAELLDALIVRRETERIVKLQSNILLERGSVGAPRSASQ